MQCSENFILQKTESSTHFFHRSQTKQTTEIVIEFSKNLTHHQGFPIMTGWHFIFVVILSEFNISESCDITNNDLRQTYEEQGSQKSNTLTHF